MYGIANEYDVSKKVYRRENAEIKFIKFDIERGKSNVRAEPES